MVYDKEAQHQSDEPCRNCKRTNHKFADCYSKGGAKEGQGPRQKKNANKSETVVIAANNNEGELFVFTCTLNHIAVAKAKQGQGLRKKNIQQKTPYEKKYNKKPY